MKQQKEFSGKKYKCKTGNAEDVLLNNDAQNAKDPVFIANLMYSLKEERERSNSMIATVIRKIEALEMKVERLERELKEKAKRKEIMLGDVDSELLKYVKRRKKVSAEEVQKKFNYRGKNAASSRLHRLYSLGCLNKRQAGRKVYYLVK